MSFIPEVLRHGEHPRGHVDRDEGPTQEDDVEDGAQLKPRDPDTWGRPRAREADEVARADVAGKQWGPHEDKVHASGGQEVASNTAPLGSPWRLTQSWSVRIDSLLFKFTHNPTARTKRKYATITR